MVSGTQAIDYFLAAHQSELHLLNQLCDSADLTAIVTDLIHELQKERGLSNIYLVSSGQRFSEQRQQQLDISRQAEQILRSRLTSVPDCHTSKPSFYSRIAFALNELDQLEQARSDITSHKIEATDNTLIFSQVISRLLLIVFEIADHSTCPETTRALIALFNFMQGKEYAGQERAWGAIGFAAGQFQQEHLIQLESLHESQQQCIEVFIHHARQAHKLQWSSIDQSGSALELEKMRRVFQKAGTENQLPEQMSEIWYETATSRMNEMQALEKIMLQDLIHQAREQFSEAEQQVIQHKGNLNQLLSERAASALPQDDTKSLIQDPHSSALPSDTTDISSLFDLIQQQSVRLQQLNSELGQVRQSLEDRKIIERAKGLVMQQHNVSEQKAYQSLRRAAMDTNSSLIEICQRIIQSS